jgi:SAM-dependent methyltransferase
MAAHMTERRAKDFAQYYWQSDPIFAAWLARNLSAYGNTICDIGAGTGNMLHALGKHFRGIELVEPNLEMLKMLRRRARKNKRARVYEASGERIPLPDNAVDIALMKSSLHHAEDPEKCLEEMARVAKSAFAVVEVISPDAACDEYARELVLRKELGRTMLFSEQSLVDLFSGRSNECRIMHFDQVIDLNIWLQFGDIPESEQCALLELARSQNGIVRNKMQIREVGGHLMQLRRMALAIGTL